MNDDTNATGFFDNGLGMIIYTHAKPNWFRRLMYKICFDWEWNEIE